MEKKLSPMEYKYMEFIWKFPQGVYSNLIYDEFPQAQGTKGLFYFISKRKVMSQSSRKESRPFIPR